MIPGRQRGIHTWDLKWDYLRCPKCGHITEDRRNYTYTKGMYIKEVTCEKCSHTFQKEIKPNSLGPLFNEPS